jgi:primosomal protein N'
MAVESLNIARVTLEMAIRKEFDYSIPEEFAGRVEVGSRVKVPFGGREVLGNVTAIVKESPHSNLRPILKVIGGTPLLTPKILKPRAAFGANPFAADKILVRPHKAENIPRTPIFPQS